MTETSSSPQSVYAKVLPVIVWILRLSLGGVFVLSGITKGIDLWGFIYKIEEYFSVWGIEQPRSLVVMAALGISCSEFTLGLMLMIGCYRRFSAWALLVVMAVCFHCRCTHIWWILWPIVVALVTF